MGDNLQRKFRKRKSVTYDNLIHSVCVCYTFTCVRNISQETNAS
jgi:hypothetical protein